MNIEEAASNLNPPNHTALERRKTMTMTRDECVRVARDLYPKRDRLLDVYSNGKLYIHERVYLSPPRHVATIS
jgi:hypothetical protein